MTDSGPASSGDTAVVLMLDPTDRQGYAGPGWDADDVVRVRAALRSIWPDLPHLLNTWRPIPADPANRPDADHDESPYFTDARRLADAVAIQPYRRLVVVRPSVALLPDDVLRRAVEHAYRDDLDVLTLRGVPPDILHVVSRRAMALVAATGGVPGALTVPQALQRLAAAGVALESTGLQIRLDDEVAAVPLDDMRRLPSRWWRGMPASEVLTVPSPQRIAWALDADRRAGDAEVARILTAAARHLERTQVRPTTLVCLPSMYQTGAHAAWAELLDELSPKDVAFVVGGATLLHERLIAAGFLVFGVRDGLAPNSSDMAVVEGALRLLASAVVHLDGAECAGIAAQAAAGGARVVQHVRLNVVDRFRAAFVHADAVIGSSSWLCEQIATRVAPSTRVVHLPDGVRRAPVEPRLDGPADTVNCLCVGRVEPAKGQLRVIEVFRALAALRPATLTIVGPCGNDPDYGDAVLDAMDEAPTRPHWGRAGTAGPTCEDSAAPGRIVWQPSMPSVAPLYRQSQVVLVGSRNEALGMVGLEALAAGLLIVAHRSTGYEAIVDPANREGVLFDDQDDADEVAARILAALDELEAYAAAAASKAAAEFDARRTARRLTALWNELGVRQQ